MIRQNKQSAISQSPLAWDYDHPASQHGDRFSISLEETISLKLADCRTMFSVEPHQKHRPLCRLRLVGQSCCALAVVVHHSYPHPPVSHGTHKLQDFGRLVTLLQVPRQFSGRLLPGEGADLNRPEALPDGQSREVCES